MLTALFNRMTGWVVEGRIPDVYLDFSKTLDTPPPNMFKNRLRQHGLAEETLMPFQKLCVALKYFRNKTELASQCHISKCG